MLANGKVFKYGDNIDTDVIIPVIASTFARIFYRNAINIGLPILECDEAAMKIEEGDKLEIDFNSGIIKNISKNEEYKAEPFPEFMQNIISNGGLIKSIEKTMIK